jgi:hypothetical protein
MFLISEEVSIRNVHKQCFNIMLLNIAGVGFLYIKQVLIRY